MLDVNRILKLYFILSENKKTKLILKKRVIANCDTKRVAFQYKPCNKTSRTNHNAHHIT